MQPAGLKMVELAKQTGTWTALEKIDAMEIPHGLRMLFIKNKTAAKHFDAFPPSAKKAILQWIDDARRPETKQKRMEETVALAEKNTRANHVRK